VEHPDPLDDVVAHLARTTPLSPEVCRRMVDEVVAAVSEPVDDLLRRRHRELQATGLANPEIFEQIAHELTRRPVAAPVLSARQIRRAIYG